MEQVAGGKRVLEWFVVRGEKNMQQSAVQFQRESILLILTVL